MGREPSLMCGWHGGLISQSPSPQPWDHPSVSTVILSYSGPLLGRVRTGRARGQCRAGTQPAAAWSAPTSLTPTLGDDRWEDYGPHFRNEEPSGVTRIVQVGGSRASSSQDVREPGVHSTKGAPGTSLPCSEPPFRHLQMSQLTFSGPG